MYDLPKQNTIQNRSTISYAVMRYVIADW